MISFSLNPRKKKAEMMKYARFFIYLIFVRESAGSDVMASEGQDGYVIKCDSLEACSFVNSY